MTWIIAGILVLLLLADWSQTVTVTKAGRELNPLIGRKGERIPPAIYFPLAVVGLSIAVLFLPGLWGQRLGILVLGLEGSQVWTNYVSGYPFRWWWASSN